MYSNIMVAVDNSECSGHAVEVAVDLARVAGARLTGAHVYAARLHDTRFRQLEPGLPERYQRGEVLRHQRDVHEDLIGRGLGMISDSYLDLFEERCRREGLTPRRKALEGRNYQELVRDTRESGYDLVVVGAHGLGRVARSVLGSVCERVARLVECDVLVVRNRVRPGEGRRLVAIDGSPHSFGALRAALDLGQAYGSEVSAVAAFDPFFHSAAFKSIAGVLSPEASKLFRFKEQERLHDEIIDAGLAAVYRSHLEEAQGVAQSMGIPLEVEVLEGKPFDAIASHVQKLRPSLLILGRVGIHHAEGVTLGSTTENLLRFATCNILVANRRADSTEPEGGTEEAGAAVPDVRWSEEAEQRLKRAPLFVRGMARKRIEAFARQNGYSEITLEVYEQARERFGM